MKTIIAGSRTIQHLDFVWNVISMCPWIDDITEVVSGTCRGVDRMGEVYAKTRKWPIKRFPANWKAYGKKAGPMRNEKMARYADALIVVWDGESKGTKNMIKEAKKYGLRIFRITIEVL